VSAHSAVNRTILSSRAFHPQKKKAGSLDPAFNFDYLFNRKWSVFGETDVGKIKDNLLTGVITE
jgi:hypothetical protein